MTIPVGEQAAGQECQQPESEAPPTITHQASLLACCVAAVLLVICIPAFGSPNPPQLLVELNGPVSAGSV